MGGDALKVEVVAAVPENGTAASAVLGKAFELVDRDGAVRVIDARGVPSDAAALVRAGAKGVPVVLVVDGPEQMSLATDLRAAQVLLGSASPDEWVARVRLAGNALPAELREGLRKTIAHDLRSPLAIISGQCELLLAGIRGELAPKQVQSVEKIAAQGDRLAEMLEKLRTQLGGE